MILCAISTSSPSRLRTTVLLAKSVSVTSLASLTDVGLMKIRDVERGTEEWIDTSSARVRKAYAEWWQKRQSSALEICRRNGVDITSVATDEDYVVALMNLFKKRG